MVPAQAGRACGIGQRPSTATHDLSKDPGEKNNVAAQYPDRVREMTAALDKIRAGSGNRN